MKKAWWDRWWGWIFVALLVAGWGVFALVILGIVLAVRWLNG